LPPCTDIAVQSKLQVQRAPEILPDSRNYTSIATTLCSLKHDNCVKRDLCTSKETYTTDLLTIETRVSYRGVCLSLSPKHGNCVKRNLCTSKETYTTDLLTIETRVSYRGVYLSLSPKHGSAIVRTTACARGRGVVCGRV